MTANKTARTYRISAGTLRWLRTLAEREQKSDQREVCGLIVSEDSVRIRLIYLRNEALGAGEFVISGQSLESAARRARGRGMKVLGTFHSHPISEAISGPRDFQTAKSGSLMLIYDVCGRQARLWEIHDLRGRPHAREPTLDVIRRPQDIVEV